MNKYLKVLKFGLVGFCNTIISLLIYYLLIYLNFNYAISIATGYIISSIVGYFLNKNWVFKYKAEKEKRSIFRYYALYISALLLNLVLMYLFINILNVSKIVSPIFVLMIVVPYNYIFSKIWVFNKNVKFVFLDKIKQFVLNNKLLILVIFMFLMVFIPIFLNNIYNQPAADDFSNYNFFLDTLGNKEKTFLNVVLAILVRSKETYFNWQGTYFSNILFFANPLLISVNAYKIASFISQIFYCFCVLYFFSSFSKIKNFVTFKDSLIIGLLYLILSTSFMYSISDGLYWFTANAIYLIPFSMSFLFFGLIVKNIYNDNNKFLYFLILILAFCLGGTNYVTGLFVSFVLFFITLFMFIKKDRHLKKYIILLILFVVGFLFNILAPGNFVRISNFKETSILEALAMTVPLSKNMIISAITTTLLLPLLILLTPIFVKMQKNIKYNFKNPVLIFGILFIVFTIFFAPMTYSYGTYYEELRVKNIQLFYLYIMIMFSFFYLIGNLIKNYKNIFESPNLKIACYVTSFICTIIMVGYIGFDNIKTRMVSNDLIYGVSESYDKCMDDLFYQLSIAKEDIVKIKNCEKYTETLHYYRLSNDENWIKTAMEKYFKKEILVEED